MGKTTVKLNSTERLKNTVNLPAEIVQKKVNLDPAGRNITRKWFIFTDSEDNRKLLMTDLEVLKICHIFLHHQKDPKRMSSRNRLEITHGAGKRKEKKRTALPGIPPSMLRKQVGDGNPLKKKPITPGEVAGKVGDGENVEVWMTYLPFPEESFSQRPSRV